MQYRTGRQHVTSTCNVLNLRAFSSMKILGWMNQANSWYLEDRSLNLNTKSDLLYILVAILLVYNGNSGDSSMMMGWISCHWGMSLWICKIVLLVDVVVNIIYTYNEAQHFVVSRKCPHSRMLLINRPEIGVCHAAATHVAEGLCLNVLLALEAENAVICLLGPRACSFHLCLLFLFFVLFCWLCSCLL